MPNNPERAAMVEICREWLADLDFMLSTHDQDVEKLADFTLAQVAATRAEIAADLNTLVNEMNVAGMMGTKPLRAFIAELEKENTDG